MDIVYAKVKDILWIQDIILKRCIWIRSLGITYQWDKNYYMREYDYDYFTKRIKDKELYVAKIKDETVGVIVLKEKDISRFEDDGKALYIHNLATDRKYKGIGAELIDFAKKVALKKEKQYLRLDCVKKNIKLNDYYEKLGFYPVGSKIISEDYEASLREMKL